MTVQAIYFFREDGVPLLSRFYDEQAPRIEGLVAPFLVSINSRIEEITGAGMRQINLSENMLLLIEEFAGINCAAVVSDFEDGDLQLDIILRKFYKLYHRSLSGKGWTGKLDDYKSIIQFMEELLDINPGIVIQKIPHNFLDSFTMAEFEKPGQRLIRELIKNSEIDHQKAVEIVGDEVRLEHILDQLFMAESIGIKEKSSGDLIYFTKT